MNSATRGCEAPCANTRSEDSLDTDLNTIGVPELAPKPPVANVEPAEKRSKSKSSMDTDSSRCVTLNERRGPNEENFVSNYVKTSRYECWNIVCMVQPLTFFRATAREALSLVLALRLNSKMKGIH